MKSFNCILLVDDDEINNIIAYSLISRRDVAEKIQTANNGIGALNFLRRYYMEYRSLPDLIILDVEMPVMNGLEFEKAFRETFFPEKYHPSIIFLTNYSPESRKDLFKEIEDFLIIEKPLDEKKLDNIIDYHFNIALKNRQKRLIKEIYRNLE